MTNPDEIGRRFDEIKSCLESIHLQLGLRRNDGTLVVDVGDLDGKCGRYQEQVDRLLELATRPEINDLLGERLIAISVAIEDLAACCADLKGPFDRMVSAVYERLPDDSRYADDAS